jgi:translocation and assembly module TamB
MRKWAALAAFGAAGFGAGAWLLLDSAWLQAQVERQVRGELESATGAAVEISGFSFDWRSLRLSAGPLILRGTERRDQAPLLRVERVSVGLRINPRSAPVVRVATVELERPVASIYAAADGSTNLPKPSREDAFPEALLNIELARLEIREGEIRWNEQRIPVEIRATGVAARTDFDAAAREYRGFAAADRIEGLPVAAATRIEFALSAARLSITSASIRSGKSSVTATGEIANWERPAGAFETKLLLDLPEAAKTAGVTELREGTVEGDLVVRWETGPAWRAEGQLRGRGITAEVGAETLRDVAISSRVMAAPDAARFENLTVRAWGGDFLGRAEIAAWREFAVSGQVRGMEIPGRLAARVSGEVSARGVRGRLESASAKLRLDRTQGEVPVKGEIEAAYRGGDLAVRRSALTFGRSEVNLSGDLAQGMAFRIRTRDAGELLPALRLVSEDAPAEVPFSLEGQPAELVGTLFGPVEKPRISARMTAVRLRVEGQTLERVSAEGEISASELSLRRASLERDGVKAAFSGRASLSAWRLIEESTIEGQGEFERADIAALAREFDAAPLSVSGLAEGSVAIRGTMARPEASGEIRVSRGSVAGEAFDRARAAFRWTRDRATLRDVEVARGDGRISGSAHWTPAEAQFSLTAREWDISHRVPIEQRIVSSFRAQGSAAMAGGRWLPKELNADFEVRAAAAGAIRGRAETQAGELRIAAQGDVFGSPFTSEGRWKLEPGLPGSGGVRVASMTESTIARAAKATGDLELPFLAQISGEGTFSGKLLEPESLVAQFRLPVFQLTPRQQLSGVSAADLTLRNAGPVILAAGASGVVIQQARFMAKETELQATGNIAFRRTDQMNFLVRGNVNLAVLDAFNPDIAAAGRSTLNLRVRGPARVPRLEGRLAFENAAFNLRGFPNGLENVNGAVIFDRNRASVDGLRGQSGGGDVLLNGYVGFGAELSYQLQMALNKVRVRYPEGVSTQANASLVLTGTARRSLLAGNVTVLRAGLSPATDVGGLLAASPRIPPLAEGVPDFRRGLQLDLRLETAQSAQFTTELTKNVEADIDVRVRGTALRPVVLGRVSVTQGTVQFFGTDYTINRGEVNFVNPVTVEPQVDLDLETRVRGILVSVSFTGPLNRMSMTYRSDPPLQSQEILALLAVGRTPTSATTLGFSSVRGNDLLSAGGTAVLSSALSQGAAASNNLQRFFGVTRLKIDPQLIGLDNTPQSRISFEQPISRDVTVTYSQTLARAQGQLVRVQWDLNRQWSALLTRDENGIVSVDFVFRKSFR